MAGAIDNQPVSGNKPKRPLILTIVSLLLFARVILLASVTVVGLAGLISSEGQGVFLSVEQVVMELALVGATVLLFVAALGLWLLRPWAWQMNMIILGFYLVIDLWTHYSTQGGMVNDASLLLNILIVFYLVQKDVRMLFINQPAGEVKS